MNYEYRIKSSTVTCTFLCFIWDLICKIYTFDQYFWLEITNTFTTKQSIIFFIN